MHFVNAKGILSAQNGMNVYRGCTHGCIYCDSRSACYHMEHAFEDIEVKQNAPQLLEKALRSKRKKCMIATGAMCDPYMPCEETLNLTRQCLQVIDRYGFGATVLTKSDRVLRDLPLLQSIHRKAKCVVQMTLTTADEALCRLIEPNVCTTQRRVETLRILRDAGVPTVVWFAPVLPFLTDTEQNVRAILDASFDAGVKGVLTFGMGVTLREGDREYFYQALDRHFPSVKEQYVKTFGMAYECVSPQNEQLMALFLKECATHGVMGNPSDVFAYLKSFPEPGEQLSMF